MKLRKQNPTSSIACVVPEREAIALCAAQWPFARVDQGVVRTPWNIFRFRPRLERRFLQPLPAPDSDGSVMPRVRRDACYTTQSCRGRARPGPRVDPLQRDYTVAVGLLASVLNW